MPELGVYFVKPAWSAAMAAALICSGVSKSGSPAPKPQTSRPSAFIAFALLSIDNVSDGLSFAARSEISIRFREVSKTGVFKLLAAIKIFNDRFKVVFLDSHNAHFE